MQSEALKNRIQSHLDGECFVKEFSGGDDHYSVIVVSSQFNGETSLKRHRMIMHLFKEEVDSGEVHALSIQAYTPEEWKKINKT